jgi:hypothetical protein
VNITVTTFRQTRKTTRGSDLLFSVICGHCNRESSGAESEPLALALAFGNDWRLKVNAGEHITGFFTATDLKSMEIFCPRCFQAEFQP